MKLLICNGRQLEVFDVTGPIYRLTATRGVPIKARGIQIVSEAEARRMLEELKSIGLYEGERLN